MARIARVVAPGLPHPITQRGNRRQPTFFCEDDYGAYIGMMAEWCPRCGVEVWAYCLMPNPVHLVVVPKSEEGLRGALARHTEGILGSSTSGRAGGVTCGRGGFSLCDGREGFFWGSPGCGNQTR